MASKLRSPSGIALIYAAFSWLWILSTDYAVGRLALPPAVTMTLNIVKGSVFIFGSAYLIYVLLKRTIAHSELMGNLKEARARSWFHSLISDMERKVEETSQHKHRVESDLVILNQRLESLMQVLPVGVSFSLDPSCNQVTGNAAVFSQFEMQPFDNLSASSPDNDPGTQVIFRQGNARVEPSQLPLQRAARENREVGPVELEVILPSGKRWFAEVYGAPIRNSQGEAAGAVAVTVDITSRKQIALELEANRTALRLSEERYRLALENTTDAIFDWTVSRDEIYVTPRFFTMLGFEPYAFKLTKDVWISKVHREDLGLVTAANKELLSSGRFDVEYRLRTNQGGYIWIHGQGKVVLRDQNGALMRVVGSILDVTARRQADEERLSLQRKFLQSQKMEAVGRLAGGVSHDINNVLQAIVLSCQVLLMSEHQEEKKEQLEQIINVAHRGATIGRQLLAFSRQQVVQPRIVNTSDALREMEKMLRYLIREDITLSFVLDSQQSILIDPGQFLQVVMNLLINAQDAISGPGKITVSSHDSGDNIVIAISDTGCGISAEVREHIFEPFFTTKEVGKGTGLGLATVYGIVEQAGGRIEVSTQQERGACFTIVLPCAGPQQSQVNQLPRTPTGERGRIILVEDENAVRNALSSALRHCGYDVVAIDSPRSAQQALTESFDLLITDIIMPGETGLELAGRLRQLIPDLPVIYMSGYSDNDSRTKDLPPKTIYLQKPFPIEQLFASVDQLLSA